MIKANELRRGNWLMGTKPVQVDQILSDSDVGIASGGNPYSVYAEAPFKPCLEPITLTEEILEKANFKYDWGTLWSYDGSEYFPIHFSDEGACYSPDMYHHSGEPVKYVHELQNLFFALERKELEINL